MNYSMDKKYWSDFGLVTFWFRFRLLVPQLPFDIAEVSKKYQPQYNVEITTI